MDNKLDNSQLKTIFIGLLIIFFLFVLFAIYKKKDLLDYDASKENITELESFSSAQPPIAFRLFYTDWCPHCQTVKPEFKRLIANWNMAKREMYWENNKLSYRDVKLEMVNCEKDKSTCKDFDVQGYPTMVLSIGDKNIEYNGSSNTHSELMRFLETNLLKIGVSYNK